MKHKGAKFEYEDERNDELMRAYHGIIESSEYVSMPDIYKAAAELPSSRFWVSEERASIVISSMMRGDKLKNMHPNKREMFYEIYRRCMSLKEQCPNLTPYELCFRVVRQPAPKFYLTPGYVKVIICKARTKWYEERKRKLRHLLW